MYIMDCVLCRYTVYPEIDSRFDPKLVVVELITGRKPRSIRTDTRWPCRALLRSGGGEQEPWRALPACRLRHGFIGSGIGCIGLERTSGLRACARRRSEEHTSELQSLMRISYAVFCLKQTTRQHV